MRFVLQTYIDHKFDFGTVYGRLRPRWYADFRKLQDTFRTREARDKQMRDHALDRAGSVIRLADPLLLPRRIWDLWSNRVLPSWFLLDSDISIPAVVSHSWVDLGDRQHVTTPVNGYEWRVPIPKDTTLDRVRVELLNFGLQYVWLDALCLRQFDDSKPKMDNLTKAEHELDVPIIGGLYSRNRVNGICVTYFSALGRPFHVGDLSSRRHWFNRAWTLQEAKDNTIIGGLTPTSPFPPSSGGSMPQLGDYHANINMFYAILDAVTSGAFFRPSTNALYILENMRRRYAEQEVDKVAGLAYTLNSKVFPVYKKNYSALPPDNEWSRLVYAMEARFRGDLLFMYPSPGKYPRILWRPSWTQVSDRATPLPRINGARLSEEVAYESRRGLYMYKGYRLSGCVVKGLGNANPQGCCRTGTIQIIHNKISYSFTVTAHHQFPIPQGTYDLIGNMGKAKFDPGFMYWVVGRAVGDNFRKFSVLRMEVKDDRDRLQASGLASVQWVVLD
ncbi:hypothetical protein NM688_g2945 [Phlebia brevispora]|uniref:Uncharacterized protein n=1 Tax=Phlebia brevispora TaxID=194682 RepID=A0ACC1T728_9APHY|nr:hypothetical protein NM688_g2945 [Phlebia brevispora]